MDAAIVHRMNLTRELEKMKRLEAQAIDEVNAALEKKTQARIKIEELQKTLNLLFTPTDPQKELEEKLLSFI
jgi:hypothetical protein